MLTYSEYFLNCLQFCLTKARETNIAENDLAAYSIGDIFAGGVFI